MKILNLYAGIGGNRKGWGDHEIIAIEYKQEIADIYHNFFPKDKVIVTDAHQYLLEHFKEFDFIWSSPPCPSHSKIRKVFKQNKPIYPDIKLYEEILFLRGYFKGQYCIENVVSWYKPLIPAQEVGSHYYWTNFTIRPFKIKNRGMIGGKKQGWPSGEMKRHIKKTGFDITGYKVTNKIRILRNCVEPELGKHILDCAMGTHPQKTLL